MANSRELDPFEWPAAEYAEGSEKYGAELRAIQDAAFCRSERYADQQARANREGAHEDIVRFERVFVKKMRRLNVPMFAHTMVRTRAEQMAAYVRGVSRIHGDDPYPHEQWAVDIIHGTKGWNLNRKQWEIVRHVGFEVGAALGLKLQWGGNWKFYDPAHWELAEWRLYAQEA